MAIIVVQQITFGLVTDDGIGNNTLIPAVVIHQPLLQIATAEFLSIGVQSTDKIEPEMEVVRM